MHLDEERRLSRFGAFVFIFEDEFSYDIVGFESVLVFVLVEKGDFVDDVDGHFRIKVESGTKKAKVI